MTKMHVKLKIKMPITMNFTTYDNHCGRLDAVNTDLTAKFVQSCQNFDGGFGSRVGAESHAGLIYTCLGTLAITGHLHTCDQDRLGWWLAERQLPSGGLNGRPGTEECPHHV